MANTCSMCGFRVDSGLACPRCGAPLPAAEGPSAPSTQADASDPRPPLPLGVTSPSAPSVPTSVPYASAVASAPPIASGTPVVPPRSPAPVGSAPAALGGRRPKVWQLIAAVLGLTLIAGAAFAASGAFPKPAQGSSASSSLKVTGQPVSLSGSWSSGTKEVWRIDPAHYNDVEDVAFPNYTMGPMTLTSKAWAMGDHVGDTGIDLWGLSPDTGKLMWGGPGSPARGVRGCASSEVAGLVPCLEWALDAESKSVVSLALVDWATGTTKASTLVSALGVTTKPNAAWDVQVISQDIILRFPDYPDAAGDYLGDLAKVVTVRVSGDGKTARWMNVSKGCEDGSSGAGATPRSSHGVLSVGYGTAIDEASGQSIFGQTACATIVAESTYTVTDAPGASLPSTTKAPDGTSLATLQKTNFLQVMGSTLPPQPLRIIPADGLETGPAEASAILAGKLSGFDPATGRDTWQSPLPITVQRSGTSTSCCHALLDGGRLIVASGSMVAAVNPVTGDILWWQDLMGDSYAYPRSLADVVVFQDYDHSVALNPATGTPLWWADGNITVARGPDGRETLLQDAMDPITKQHYVARLAPADRVTQAAAMPAGAPGCPSGMTAVSWTQYADGAVLLCQQGTNYQVVTPTHTDWHANSLTFTDGGYVVEFGNGTTIRVVLGGQQVYVQQSGGVKVYTADTNWNWAKGPVTFAVPKDVKSCPAGSWPLALSTYNGGWLLVCGTSAASPTSLQFSANGSVVDGSSVTAANGGYCADTSVGKVCGYRAPALVTVSTSGGVTQHSVGSNYFDGAGQGGAGTGTGSYGVDTPTAEAKDQVRYLTQILQKSSAGRTSLEEAIGQVRTCSNLPDAITKLNRVTGNREELLSALDSTPVDAVPNGQELVAKLRKALELSRDSDQIWVKWAQSEQATTCAQGQANPLYVQVTQMNTSVATAKGAFVTQWNSAIAPAYGAPSFTVGQI